MQGKKYFSFVFPVLWVFSRVLFILPRSFVSSLWSVLDFFPGLLGVGLRYAFALRLAKKIGKNVYFGPYVVILKWHNIIIGNNVSIHAQSYIDASGEVEIGSDVSIAHQSSLVSFNHTWDNLDAPIRSNPTVYGKIKISDDVWIGCGVRILSGVVISSRSVVAAGAVVVKNVPGNVLVAGVPAKFVRRI